MTSSFGDRQHNVYLAFRRVFTGPAAQLRRYAKVQERLEKNSGTLQPLLASSTLDAITRVAQHLLERDIFASDELVAAEFPDLFEDFKPPPSDDGNAFITDLEEECLDEDAQPHQEPSQELQTDFSGVAQDEEFASGNVRSQYFDALRLRSRPAEPLKQFLPLVEANTLSALAQIPFANQHSILAGILKILEKTRYNFTRVWLPNILEQKGWDCAHAAELTRWTRTLKAQKDGLPAETFKEESDPFSKDQICMLDELRHTTVHRKRITLPELKKLMTAAEGLTQNLFAFRPTAKIRTIRQAILQARDDLVQDREDPESELHLHLRSVQQKIEDLKMEERSVLGQIEADKIASRNEAILRLEETVHLAFEDGAVEA